MKQSNFIKCVTGLTLSICLLTGSTVATAKAGFWKLEPLQKKQQDLFVIGTNYRIDLASKVDLASKAENKAQENKLAALTKPVNATAKAVPIQPEVLKATVKAAKQTAQKNVEKTVQTAKEHSLEIPSGNTIKYSRLIPVKATAYTAAAEENGMWGAFDYYGNPLKLGTIAVDPDIIPMGSTVFVTGYSFDGLPAKGMLAKATDQGSAVKGKRIDIFVPTSRADATKFGMQDVKVYIVE